MSFYEEDHEELERGNYEGNYGGGAGYQSMKIGGFLLATLFAPTAAISALVFYVFLRRLRWKPRVTIIPISILVILLTLFSSGPLSNLGIESIRTNFKAALGSYLYLSLILGLILGFLIILYKVYDLRRHPEYKHIRGWAYGFEYASTPLERQRKKKNIQSLIDGNEFDYEKAPIGVIDDPVKFGDLEGTLDTKNSDQASIVYRYYSEAMAHTLITGKTGSGKALHIDTEIRCKEKGWTTVGEIEIGDTIYDESGNYTKVEEIYQPMTLDHYELTFKNGQTVKACGDHLWNIGNVSDGHTFNTRDLLRYYSVDTDYEIKHHIDGIPFTHTILRIKRIDDEPEDYLCFTVDAPSHLFLITRSHIPTHNTVTMLSLIQNDILAGNPVCVIDFKKSPDLIYFLSKWAEENGRDFYHFLNGKPGTYRNPYKDNQATYDPLSTGGATAKADMILNLRTWDSASEVFKKRTQDVLQSLFFLLERTPRENAPGIDWDSGGLAKFVSALDLNNFKIMIEYMAKDMEAGKLSAGDVRRYNTLIELYKELSSKTKSDLKAQILELLSIARTLIVSNYGDWLASGASKYHIDLMDLATSQDGPIVLFSFNQQEEPEFAKYIGSIVMSDLSRVSALKNAKGDITEFGVYIDEFQTLDPVTVKDNLEKARSSKMYITLSLQSIDQIISSAANQGEAIANAILDTCANFIFHDGSGYDTAEKMAKIIGKTDRYIYKSTSKSDNKLFNYKLMTVQESMVSKDINQDWLIPPSEFQSLESPVKSNGYKATAYIINKSPEDTRFERSGGALARKVHVVVAEETAKGVPRDFKKQIFIPQVQSFNDFKEADLGLTELTEDSTLGLQEDEVDLHEGDWGIIDDVEEVEIVSQPVNLKSKRAETTQSTPNEPVKSSGLPSMPDFEDLERELVQSVKKAEKPVKSDIYNVSGPVGKSLGEPVSKLTSFQSLQKGKTKVKVEKVEKEDIPKEKPKKDGFTLPDLD